MCDMRIRQSGSPKRLDESYERGCQGKIFPPSSPRGDGCGDLHPAQSEIWRGFVFAACFSHTKAIDGFCSTGFMT